MPRLLLLLPPFPHILSACFRLSRALQNQSLNKIAEGLAHAVEVYRGLYGGTPVLCMVVQPGVVNISYHLMTTAGVVFVWDGARTPIPQPLGQGQSATVNLAIQLPATPGMYEVRIDAVQEGVTWFSGQSIAPGTMSLQVQ